MNVLGAHIGVALVSVGLIAASLWADLHLPLEMSRDWGATSGLWLIFHAVLLIRSTRVPTGGAADA